MRNALKNLGVTAKDAVIIGDRMDTDIIAGIESNIDTVLVLSGVSDMKTLEQYAFVPHFIANSSADLKRIVLVQEQVQQLPFTIPIHSIPDIQYSTKDKEAPPSH